MYIPQSVAPIAQVSTPKVPKSQQQIQDELASAAKRKSNVGQYFNDEPHKFDKSSIVQGAMLGSVGGIKGAGVGALTGLAYETQKTLGASDWVAKNLLNLGGYGDIETGPITQKEADKAGIDLTKLNKPEESTDSRMDKLGDQLIFNPNASFSPSGTPSRNADLGTMDIPTDMDGMLKPNLESVLNHRAQPILSATPEKGLIAFRDRMGNIAYGNQSALNQFSPDQIKKNQDRAYGTAEAGQILPSEPTVGEKMITDFRNFKESGREMTPDMAYKAELLARSTGRGFDPEKGYTNTFDPAILEKYNEDVRAGLIDAEGLGRASGGQSGDGYGGGYGGQGPTQGSRLPISNYDRESMAREERLRSRPDFNDAYGGKDQRGNPLDGEELSDRKRMSGYMEEAKDGGMSHRSAKAYAQDKMDSYNYEKKQRENEETDRRTAEEDRRRRQRYEDEDRAMDREQYDLRLRETEVDLKRKLKDLNAPAESLTTSDIADFSKDLESMGASYNPKTGQIEVMEEGGFFSGDKPRVIMAGDDIYQKIQSLPNSEFFLVPTEVLRMKSDMQEGEMVEMEDGSAYELVNGKLQLSY